MKKYVYEFGKRWHVETPRGSIKVKMDSLPVSMTFKEVDYLIRRAIDESSDREKFTKEIIRECLAYARHLHMLNRDFSRTGMIA
jgi:hypothetical protein